MHQIIFEIPSFIFYLVGIIIALLIYTFIVTLLKQDASIANFTWGLGCIIITIFTFIFSEFYARQILITTLILIWGTRLLIYIFSRYKKGADPRFVSWQNRTGFLSILFIAFWIFISQTTLMIVMSYPSIYTNFFSQEGLVILDYIALITWIIGFYFEAVGDYQLHQFIKNPENKGKIMDKGLWKYSRHPNYFGEITMWWSIYLIVLNIPGGWVTIIAPLTITFLLVFITGIPLNEKVFENNPEYQKYKKKTSMLIPCWPKK